MGGASASDQAAMTNHLENWIILGSSLKLKWNDLTL